MGGVGNVLADQTAWSSAVAAGTVTASEDNGVVTVRNTGTGALNVPVTVPPGTTLSGVQGGYHQLAVGNDGLCLDVAGASTSAGAVIDQWSCKSASQGNTNQEFQFVPTSGGYGELQAQNSGDDVAVAGSSTVAGVPDIVQQTPNGASNSQWLPIAQSDGSYELQNQNSKLCLDVYHSGSNLGQQLDQWPCKSPGAGTNQAFTLSGASGLQSYGGTLSNWLNVAGSSAQTLTESVAPAITSAATAAVVAGTPFSFTVQATGEPAPALTETGTLPSGLTFVNNGNDTATISGTSTGSGGAYPITLTATNAAGTATQSFVLTNSTAPAITSPAAVTFATGVASTYGITTTGYPAPTLTDNGSALPAGLSFTDNGNGTGTISGTPAAGSQGTYLVTVSATNASGSTATLDLTVTVAAPAAPAITSPATAYFTLGTFGAFAITASGAPTPVISESGALPAGLTYTPNGSGGATITGDPTATGTTNLSITVANGISPNATQTLSVIVGQAPTITSASSATALVGTPFGFTVAATGYPAPSIGETGPLPTGLTFINNGNGTATISGTPASTSAGSYVLDLIATNGTATSSQTFTLTVSTPQAPAFTSAATATETAGTAFSFPVSATGTPTPTLTLTGTPPSGVTFTANTNGTASLFGTTVVAAGVYHLTLAATNSVGTTSQAFTLAVNLQGGYHQFAINNDSLCLDVYGASVSAGAVIDQWTCKSASQGNTNQEFQFVPTSGGYGELQAQNSGDDVAVAGSSTAAGVPDIVQQSPNGASNSQWLPIAQSNGSYELQNQNSKLCLDVYQAGSNLGQQLDQWPCKSPGAGTNQAFALR